MAAEFKVNKKLIADLARLLEETGLGEIEYESGGARIRVARPAPAAAPPAPAPAAAPTPASPPAGKPAGMEAAGREASGEVAGAVKAPMVGSVYVAPEPDAPPFVRPGDYVKAGQTVLLIEVMKTMNAVNAPCDGVVREILVENGAAVEYGEILMTLTPEKSGGV